MKKNILLITAALFLFLGNQSVTAQVKIKKEVKSTVVQKDNVKAKEKMASLIRPLGLDKKQQEKVYDLFSKTQQKLTRAENEAKAEEFKAKQAKMDKYITLKMKEILNEKQYQKYLDLNKN